MKPAEARKPCSVPGCHRFDEHGYRGGLCQTHYMRKRDGKKIRDVTCAICGTQFQTWHNKKRYCDWKCYRESLRLKRQRTHGKKVRCPLCNGTFPLRQVFAGSKGAKENQDADD